MEAPNLHKLTWLEFKSGSAEALHSLYKQHYLGRFLQVFKSPA